MSQLSNTHSMVSAMRSSSGHQNDEGEPRRCPMLPLSSSPPPTATGTAAFSPQSSPVFLSPVGAPSSDFIPSSTPLASIPTAQLFGNGAPYHSFQPPRTGHAQYPAPGLGTSYSHFNRRMNTVTYATPFQQQPNQLQIGFASNAAQGSAAQENGQTLAVDSICVASPQGSTGDNNNITSSTSESLFYRGLPASSNSSNLYIQVPSSENEAGVSTGSAFWVTVPWDKVSEKVSQHHDVIFDVLSHVTRDPVLKRKAEQMLQSSTAPGGSEVSGERRIKKRKQDAVVLQTPASTSSADFSDTSFLGSGDFNLPASPVFGDDGTANTSLARGTGPFTAGGALFSPATAASFWTNNNNISNSEQHSNNNSGSGYDSSASASSISSPNINNRAGALFASTLSSSSFVGAPGAMPVSSCLSLSFTPIQSPLVIRVRRLAGAQSQTRPSASRSPFTATWSLSQHRPVRRSRVLSPLCVCRIGTGASDGGDPLLRLPQPSDAHY